MTVVSDQPSKASEGIKQQVLTPCVPGTVRATQEGNTLELGSPKATAGTQWDQWFECLSGSTDSNGFKFWRRCIDGGIAAATDRCD